MNITIRSTTLRPWFIWGLGAFFFFFEYSARLAPSIMASELMQTFNVTAFALGSLSAYFYITYLSMQVPVGLLIDRFGIHKLLTIAAFLCGVSTIGLGLSTHLYMAELCRLILGFSAAFAFVSALKLALIWLPQRWFGLLAGVTQALGMLGAFMGDGPMASIVEVVGWRVTLIGMSFMFFALSVLIFLFVKDRRHVPAENSDLNHDVSKLMDSLKKVFSNKQCWANALFVSMLYAPTAAFGELWGVSFLSQSYNISKPEAAFAVGLLFIGWGIGGPLAGWISDVIQRRKPIMLTSVSCSLVLFTLIIYYPHLSIKTLDVLLFLYGLTNTGVVIAYAVAGELCSRRVSGTSLAFANIASVVIGAIMQPIIGHILDKTWTGTLINGAPVYTMANYRIAFMTLPFCLLIGLFSLKFVKETYCKRPETLS